MCWIGPTENFFPRRRFVDKLTWAKGIDAQGRPIRSGLEPTAEGTRSVRALAAPPTGLRRRTTSLPISSTFLRWKNVRPFFLKPQEFAEGKDLLLDRSEKDSGGDSQKILLAFDLDKQSFAWRYPQVGSGHSDGGTMTTAGGLVFFGDDAQSFEAVDARTGKPLVALQHRTGFQRVSHELRSSGQTVCGHRRGK